MNRKIIFLGTTRFAAEILEFLVLNNFTITFVVSQINEPLVEYDNKKLTIKDVVKKYNLTLYKPKKIIEIKNEIIKAEPDLLLTCAYGQFLPEEILSIPKFGSWNIHGSLLPKLRGGAPIQWAIINCFQESGITIMQMAKEMDAGHYISQAALNIAIDETYGSLYLKLIDLTKTILPKTLNNIFNNSYKLKSQDKNKVTFGYIIKKPSAQIIWHNDAQTIDCFVRGLNPDPIAFSYINNVLYKIYFGKKIETKVPKNILPGTILKVTNDGIEVATIDKIYLITDIQREGKKHLSLKDFINGNKDKLINNAFE